MSEAKEHIEKKHGGHGGGHGGGSHEEHEGAPEWLISFADNVTLLMSFFVIMLAMNLQPKSSGGAGDSKETGGIPPTPEMLDMAIAIRDAFHNPVDPDSSNPIDLPLIRRLLERGGSSQAERDGQIGREHDVQSIRPTDYYSPAGSVPFDEASASLSAAGTEALRQMTRTLRGQNLVIEVRGHVSATESFGKPDRGVRLSYERALSVAGALAAQGVPWAQLRIVACGDAERLVPIAHDAAGHRTNQRVELIVTDQVMKDHADEDSITPPNSPSRPGPP
ncbi:MAG: OmpA family protein [Planctomycetota bacterium]